MTDSRTNEDLGVALCRDRDAAAYVELLGRFQCRQWPFAPGPCTEEVEAVLDRWRRRGAPYDGTRPFEPYFAVAVREQYLLMRRTRRRRERLLKEKIRTGELAATKEGVEPIDPHDVFEDVCRGEVQERVRVAVAELPPPGGAVVAAVRLEEIPFREVAAHRETSVASIQRAVERGEARLGQSLRAIAEEERVLVTRTQFSQRPIVYFIRDPNMPAEAVDLSQIQTDASAPPRTFTWPTS